MIGECLLDLLSFSVMLYSLEYLCGAHLLLTNKKIIAALSLEGIAFFIFYIFDHELIREFSIIWVLFIVVLIFSHRRLFDVLLFSADVLLYLTFCVFPSIFSETLFPYSDFYIEFLGYRTSVVGLITDIIPLCILIPLRHIINRNKFSMRLSLKEILGSFVLFVCTTLGCISLFDSSAIENPIYRIGWRIFLFIGFTAFATYYFYSIIHSRSVLWKELSQKNEINLLKLQLEELNNLNENNEATKRLRHDIKNHLAVIDSLCNEKKYEELRDYTSQLSDIVPSSTLLHTGNKIADVILSNKMKLAQEAQINFTFDGQLNALDYMDSVDLCTLFFNAYDNAIEACNKMENAYINTRVLTHKNFIHISISNPVPHKISIHNNSVPTSKTDKSEHGFGIQQMKQVVEKYHGKISIQCSETEFSLEITLLT